MDMGHDPSCKGRGLIKVNSVEKQGSMAMTRPSDAVTHTKLESRTSALAGGAHS